MDTKKELEPRGMEVVSPDVELPKSLEQNLEVESWVEKIEKKFARIPNQTQDVTDDQVIVQPVNNAQPPITLPVTQQTMQRGKKGKIEEGVTWLVAWAIRQIKLLSRLGRKVRLQDMPEIIPNNQNTKESK